MMVIVEGLDKCGKTTLVNYLIKNLDNAFVMKNGFRPNSNNTEEREKILYIYEKLFINYMLNFKNDVLIMDRYFISELVYGTKRGYNALETKGMKYFLNMVQKRKDIILIYCRTDYDNIKKKFIEDREEYVEIKEIKKLDKLYQKVISKLNLIKLPYDYTITKPETVVKKIKRLIEKQNV